MRSSSSGMSGIGGSEKINNRKCIGSSNLHDHEFRSHHLTKKATSFVPV